MTDSSCGLRIKVLTTPGVRVGFAGPQGPAGVAGVGVPAGGTTGQVLAKVSNADYDDEWVDPQQGGVLSVFGRTGAVVALAGDYNTSLVTESGNLYFTQARAIASPITGYVSGAGVVAATDTILQAIQKLNGNDLLKAPLASPTFTGTVILPPGQVVNGVTLTTGGGTTNFLRADGTYAAPPSGGSSAFSAITSGTNTSAAMVVGTGSSLAATGSGTIAATSAATLATGRTISGTGEATFTTSPFDGSAAVSGTVTLINASVIGKVLTGFSASAGVVTATDTILQAFNKIVGNTAALVTGVSSVFGRSGAVTAQSGDYTTAQVTESGNLYFTNARAIASTLTGYVSGAGTISASDTVLGAIQKLNGNIAAFTISTVPYTGATTDVDLGANNLSAALVNTSGVKALTSAGLLLESNSGTDVALLGAGGGAGVTFYGGVILDAQTASRLVSTDGSKNLTSLDTATYPSLTEIAYVKGVTSAIQTQINTKITASSSDVLTNKTIIATSNVVEESSTIASSGTPTPTGGSLRNFFTITALATNPTFAVPSGTPAIGNYLTIRIKDNGTPRTLAFNAIYRAGTDVTLPTTTTTNKTMYLGFRYNEASLTWDLLAKSDGF